MNEVLISLKLRVSEVQKRMMRAKSVEKHDDLTAWALDTLLAEASKTEETPADLVVSPEKPPAPAVETPAVDESLPKWQRYGYASQEDFDERAPDWLFRGYSSPQALKEAEERGTK